MSVLSNSHLPLQWAYRALTASCRRARHRQRLGSLLGTEGIAAEEQSYLSVHQRLNDRFGRAGLLDASARAAALRYRRNGVIGCLLAGLLLGMQVGVTPAILGAIAGSYLGLVGYLLALRMLQNRYERELLFYLPLTMETLILLVESGLGVFPAIERIVKSGSETNNPVLPTLAMVCDLAERGVPFSEALEMVARETPLRALAHALLHLDISATEGGAVIPALRSLSGHGHAEWRLSVETRVRRLENLVVFPVFVGVLGLLLLSASVPLVPLLEFAETAKQRQSEMQSQRANQQHILQRGVRQ